MVWPEIPTNSAAGGVAAEAILLLLLLLYQLLFLYGHLFNENEFDLELHYDSVSLQKITNARRRKNRLSKVEHYI